MKKAVLLLVLFMVAFVIGCGDESALSPSDGHGMVDTKRQRRRRIATIMDMNDRSIQDDFDEFWFIDNNLKLMPWEISVGD